ncbi:MAG: NifB/NifX family molybdenum-iron cluster-binding protein [Bacteroidales bacterium]
MKYAITSIEKSIKSKCSSHFVRAEYFAIYNKESGSLEFIENPYRNLPRRAGPSVVKMLSSMNVQIAVSSEFGERIKNVFESMKIGMIIISNSETTIEEIISRINGKIDKIKKDEQR